MCAFRKSGLQAKPKRGSKSRYCGGVRYFELPPIPLNANGGTFTDVDHLAIGKRQRRRQAGALRQVGAENALVVVLLRARHLQAVAQRRD